MTEHIHRYILPFEEGPTVEGVCACGATKTHYQSIEAMQEAGLEPTGKQTFNGRKTTLTAGRDDEMLEDRAAYARWAEMEAGLASRGRTRRG